MKIDCSIDKVKRTRPEEVEQFLEKDKKGEFVLIDVREPEEYEASHIPGAILIPLRELEVRHGEIEKDRKIIAYCRSGRRSMGGAILLCGLGFKDVYTMDGGMLDWNYKVITGMPEDRPELITGIEGVGDVLMIALKLEKGSQVLYKQAVGKVKFQKAVETLKRLSQMEENHMKRIYDRYGEIHGKDKIPELSQLKDELNPEYMEGGIEINKALLSMEEREFLNEIEALEVALEKEYISYDFYKRMAGLMGEAGTKDLLHELAEEERNHINGLMNEIRRLVRH